MFPALLHDPDMDPLIYKIIHLTGIAAIAIGAGGMLAGGSNRKAFAMWQGIGLLLMLVSGFGLLAKLKLGYPSFAIVKTVLWLVIGAMPVIIRKAKLSTHVAILISLVLVAIMAWLGVMKPVLW